MAVASNSWANAEENCMSFLSKRISGSEIGQNAFIGELPVGAYDVWSFAITGPSGSDFLGECTGTTRNMEAMLEGVFLVREEAQFIEQQVRTSLPVITIDNVSRLAQTAEASLVRDFIENNEGENALRVWRLTIPMYAAYNNIG